MPYKTWVVGEEVLAADFNAYIQNQVVSTFPTAAARNTAITSPVEGMVCWINDTNRLEVYNGTKWELFVLPPYTFVLSGEPLVATPGALMGNASFGTPSYNYKMLVEVGWWSWHPSAGGTTALTFTDMADAPLGTDVRNANFTSYHPNNEYAVGVQFLTATRTAGTLASVRIKAYAAPVGGGIRSGLAKVTIIQV